MVERIVNCILWSSQFILIAPQSHLCHSVGSLEAATIELSHRDKLLPDIFVC